MSPMKLRSQGPMACAALCLAMPLALQAQMPPIERSAPQRTSPSHLAHQMAQHQQPMHEGQAQMPGRMPERGEVPQDAPRFSSAQAMAARGYYDETGHQGYVAPRAMRPGHASSMPMRGWQLGQPLPSGTLFYPLPRPLVLAIGHPPSGHHYVRMGPDILLVANASGMVVDAMEGVAR